MKTIFFIVMLVLSCSTVFGEENAPKKKGFMDTHKDISGISEQVKFRKELETMAG